MISRGNSLINSLTTRVPCWAVQVHTPYWIMRYQEILVTSPEDATHVIEVVALPPTKLAAEQLARERFGIRG